MGPVDSVPLDETMGNSSRSAGAIESTVSIAGRRVDELIVLFFAAVIFLGCIVIAGVYGALTAHRRILLVQALPAAVALVAVILS